MAYESLVTSGYLTRNVIFPCIIFFNGKRLFGIYREQDKPRSPALKVLNVSYCIKILCRLGGRTMK